MLSLTRKTDYAIIALSHMAENGDRVCASREIAERFRVPSALLMNVLKTLCRQELVTSIRGAKGGYRLARSAAQISLSDIIFAVEGPVHFVQCTEQTDGSAVRCDLTEVCPVRQPVLQIHRRLNEFLREITLDQIVTDARAGRELDELSQGDTVACNVPAESKPEPDPGSARGVDDNFDFVTVKDADGNEVGMDAPDEKDAQDESRDNGGY